MRYDPYQDDGRCPRRDCEGNRGHLGDHLDPEGRIIPRLPSEITGPGPHAEGQQR